MESFGAPVSFKDKIHKLKVKRQNKYHQTDLISCIADPYTTIAIMKKQARVPPIRSILSKSMYSNTYFNFE